MVTGRDDVKISEGHKKVSKAAHRLIVNSEEFQRLLGDLK
jgi:hypothetical protein